MIFHSHFQCPSEWQARSFHVDEVWRSYIYSTCGRRIINFGWPQESSWSFTHTSSAPVKGKQGLMHELWRCYWLIYSHLRQFQQPRPTTAGSFNGGFHDGGSCRSFRRPTAALSGNLIARWPLVKKQTVDMSIWLREWNLLRNVCKVSSVISKVICGQAMNFSRIIEDRGSKWEMVVDLQTEYSVEWWKNEVHHLKYTLIIINCLERCSSLYNKLLWQKQRKIPDWYFYSSCQITYRELLQESMNSTMMLTYANSGIKFFSESTGLRTMIEIYRKAWRILYLLRKKFAFYFKALKNFISYTGKTSPSNPCTFTSRSPALFQI